MITIPPGEGGGIVSAVAAANVAVQDFAASMVTEPVVQPVPDQPAKVEPEAGVAVRETTVPLL